MLLLTHKAALADIADDSNHNRDPSTWTERSVVENRARLLIHAVSDELDRRIPVPPSATSEKATSDVDS